MASFIKNMLGGSDESTEQLIAALNERLEQLEKKNNEIEKALNEQNLKIEQLLSTLEAKRWKDNNVMGSTINTSIESSYSVGNDGGVKNEASAKSEARDVVETSKSEESTTLFFSAPPLRASFVHLPQRNNLEAQYTVLSPKTMSTAVSPCSTRQMPWPQPISPCHSL